MEDQVACFGNTGIATKEGGNLESVSRGEHQLIFTSPKASSRFEPVSNLENTVDKRTQFAYSLSTGATVQAKPISRSCQISYNCAEEKIDFIFLSSFR